MKIAAVDDEREDLSVIENYIGKFKKQEQTDIKLYCFTSSVEFLETYRAQYDIIFLDIEMPGSSGMDAAREIRQKDRQAVLIFITGMTQYAVSGYEVEAMDYVIKPVSYESFSRTLRKALKLAKRREYETLQIRSSEGIIRLPVQELLYAEKEGKNVVFHTQSRTVSERVSMAEVADRLTQGIFAKVSAGCVVNLGFVEKIEKADVTVYGMRLPLSRRCRTEFMNKFMEYMAKE